MTLYTGKYAKLLKFKRKALEKRKKIEKDCNMSKIENKNKDKLKIVSSAPNKFQYPFESTSSSNLHRQLLAFELDLSALKRNQYKKHMIYFILSCLFFISAIAIGAIYLIFKL